MFEPIKSSFRTRLKYMYITQAKTTAPPGHRRHGPNEYAYQNLCSAYQYTVYTVLSGSSIRVHHQPRLSLDWSIPWRHGNMCLPCWWCTVPFNSRDSSLTYSRAARAIILSRHRIRWSSGTYDGPQVHVPSASSNACCNTELLWFYGMDTTGVFHPADPVYVFFHNAYLKVVELIKTGILPEVLRKWNTALHHAPTDIATTEQPPEMGRYCGKPCDTDDISCTSGHCRRKHFHRSCLKLRRAPKTWKCGVQKKLNITIASNLLHLLYIISHHVFLITSSYWCINVSSKFWHFH